MRTWVTQQMTSRGSSQSVAFTEALLHNQCLRRLSHAVVRGSADAVLHVLRRNFQRATEVATGDTHTAHCPQAL